MKKLFLFFIAAALIAAFSVPAAAGDDETFSISGQYRLEFYDKENWNDNDDSNDADADNYFDQRLRTQFKFTPAEGVKAVLRLDFAEARWGDQFTVAGWSRPNYGGGTDLQVDRAYVQITKEMFDLKAGLQYIGMGNSIAFDSNVAGIVPTFIFKPVAVKLIYIKNDEGGDVNDETGFEDTDTYGLQVSFKAEAFSAGIFYVTVNDDSVTDDSPNVIGLYGKAGLGMLNLKGEINSFGGNNGPTNDYTGLQVYLNAQANITETVAAGVDILYAAGNDELDETQKTFITQTGSFEPFSRGPMWGIFYTLLGNSFDPSGDGAGTIGLQAYGKFKVAEPVTIQASLAYMEVEDDSVTTLDDAMVVNLGVTYAFAPKTSFSLAYSYAAPSYDTSTIADDAATALMGLLKVNF